MEPERLFELRRRTFDTPQFRGIEFIEVEAKSIINHVPKGPMPFRWTINPYRGCSHACSFCLGPDTPILMADGRVRPIRHLRVGDRIYGTVRDGSYRRYTVTEVLAHWSTVKPAYVVTLEDGTELISSGDHRFLSDRGWKYVVGTQQGANRRPHLTLNNKLMGTGRFAEPPKVDSDYRRGYLCGIIRGDGHIGTYSYPGRSGRGGKTVRMFRLALTDREALDRTASYLQDFDVPTRALRFSEGSDTHRPVFAIRTNRHAHICAIEHLVAWPTRRSREWMKGFLAGIFDGEGSYGRHVVRIANTDNAIITATAEALDALGFDHRIEDAHRPNGLRVVRLLGGLRDVLRFFHTVDPVISRKRDIAGYAIKNASRLRVVSVKELGVEIPMYDITTGTGDFIADGVVSHNCFARTTHTYMDMNAGRDFETKIVVKVNAPELLRRELAAKRWKGEHIAMGTATDPYQRAEGRYRLTAGILEAMADYRNPFSILTKGTLILRDLDLLCDAAKVADVGTAFSVATLDDDVWRKSEPGTPHPRKRLEAVAKLNDAGIPCGVMLAPILPGISDRPEQLMDVVKAAVDAGATHITPILLHLRPVVREEYMGWLKDAYPELVGTYEQMYATSAYASKADRQRASARVRGLISAAGGLKPRVQPAERWRGDVSAETPAPRPREKQLALL